MKAALAEAERCRREIVAKHTSQRIVTALSHAAADWLDPDDPLRVQAIERIASATGFHRKMIVLGLDFIFSAITEDTLRRLIAAEARSGAQGPRVVFYSLAGNVPGQGIPAIVCSLLARSVAIVRDSERQPALTQGFREAIRRYDPELAAMVLPVSWSHRTGNGVVERAVIDAAERIELFGTDRTVHELASRYGAARPIECAAHGARVSAGFVPSSAELSHAARDFAVDVAMYEGRGCLTPHTILVEGDAGRVVDFADALARELQALEERWPRARGSIDEERDRRRFIDEAELRSLRGTAERCLIGASGAWCVQQSCEGPEPAVAIGPGLRCVRVARVADQATTIETIAAVGAAATPLAAVGVASSDAAALERSELATAMQTAGATLVCAAGRMQAPPIDWRQDGRARLGELLRGPQ